MPAIAKLARMSSAKRITERTAAPFVGVRVNREAGTIDGCLLCGFESANGRDYPEATFRRDHKLYEGKPVNCDHGEKSTVDRRFGWFSGVTIGEGGKPRGRLNCLKSHPMFERVMEAAERNPALFGFSHVIQAETTHRDGREVVEAIKRVESIDLVADPATTKGLFEGRTVPVTFKQLPECITRHPKSTIKHIERAKRLAEDMDALGMADAPAMDAAPADDADSGDAITSAFTSAIMAIVKDALDKGMDKKSVLKTIGKLFDGHNDAQSTAGGSTSDDDAGGADDDTSTPESKQTKPALPDSWVVLDECKSKGLKSPTTSQLRALARIADAKERAEFITDIIDSLRGGAETPVSASRQQMTQESRESVAVAEPTIDEIKKRMKG